MLRRMTVTGDDAPAMLSDRNLIAGKNALVAFRQLGNATAVAVAARPQDIDLLCREPVTTKKLAGRLAAVARPLFGDGVRGEVFGLRHPDRTVESLGEPCRIAEVIGMEMRGNDSADRLPA